MTKIPERPELIGKNRIQLIAMIEKLLEEKKTWQKICTFEKKKWLDAYKIFPGLASKAEIDHMKDLEKLAGEK